MLELVPGPRDGQIGQRQFLDPGRGRSSGGLRCLVVGAEGRIVEHWAVVQPVPENLLHVNGSF